MNQRNIAVLIPAFNEAKNLGSLIPEIQKQIPDVIVVDDGSTDGTAEISKGAGAHLLRHPKNYGKGMALRTGFQYVLEKGYEGCFVLDGDGQHSPQDIPSFLRESLVPGVGVVIGNRMQETTSMPLIRFWTNRFMSLIVSRLLKEDVPDSQCGFRYIRSEVLRVSDLSASRYDIDSEILIEAKRHGFRIVSVPIQTIYRDQKSGIRPLRDTYFFLRLLLKKGKWSKRERRF